MHPMQAKLTQKTISSGFDSRISRWMDEEEDKLNSSGETSLQYVILDLSGKQAILAHSHIPFSTTTLRP
jgi:hypothetical protein